LCAGLAQTGVAGQPTEYASRDDASTWGEYYGFASHLEYFFRFPALSRSSNGLLGVKLFWDQYVAWGLEANIYLRRDRNTFEAISSVVGPLVFLRLTRRNRLRQAISLVRARQTGRWSSRDKRRAEVRPTYDAVAIERAMRELAEQDARWDREVHATGVPTLEITYESLASRYIDTITDVTRFLRVDPLRSPRVDPPLRQLSDALTEDWVRRATEDIGDGHPGVA
jgi:LPS sulfotransferase NodH